MATEALIEAEVSPGGKPWAMKELPAFPAVALQLLSLLDNPEVPLKKIVDVLKVDPALAGELLRVANSALYGLVQRIDTVNHAVVVLGTENVKRLALTVSLGRYAQRFLRHEGLRICWHHSLACALLCEELYSHVEFPGITLTKDRAYTAGLLHDIGRLAMLVCYPVEYSNLLTVARQENFDQLECERQLFDIDHCAAGQWLAGHWNLPVEYSQAIAQHHQPALPPGFPALVRCACRLADLVGYSVLQAPSTETLAEILSELPLKNAEQATADIETAGDRVRQALRALDPSKA